MLTQAYKTIGAEPASTDTARKLSAAARESLLQAVALRFWPTTEWFESACSACGRAYDMRVQLSASPRKPPGDGFPVASVGTSLGLRRFEAPNGYHEEQAARVHRAGRADSRRVFAALCGLADDAEEEANKFTSTDLDVIDAALETVSPDIADETQSICPGCGEATVARIEPLRFGLPRENEVLRSTHRLACAYGWAEETILALPTARRLKYEGLIAADEQRGIVQRRL